MPQPHCATKSPIYTLCGIINSNFEYNDFTVTDFPFLTSSFFLLLQLRHSSSLSVRSVAAEDWDTSEVETWEIDRELN